MKFQRRRSAKPLHAIRYDTTSSTLAFLHPNPPPGSITSGSRFRGFRSSRHHMQTHSDAVVLFEANAVLLLHWTLGAQAHLSTQSPWNCPFFLAFVHPRIHIKAKTATHKKWIHLEIPHGSPFVPSGSARLRNPSHPLCSPPRGARPVWSMPPASGGRSLRVHLGQQHMARPGFGKAAP